MHVCRVAGVIVEVSDSMGPGPPASRVTVEFASAMTGVCQTQIPAETGDEVLCARFVCPSGWPGLPVWIRLRVLVARGAESSIWWNDTWCFFCGW